MSRSASNLLLSNGAGAGGADAKKRLFMRELMERAPELYRTLRTHSDDEEGEGGPVRPPRAKGAAPLFASTPLRNGAGANAPRRDYSDSFRSSSTAATPPDRGVPLSPGLERGGGRGDYSETVRVTSTSGPSVTSSVQSYSHKTLPSRPGRVATETVTASETTTVTKSRLPPALGLGLATANGALANGGVVIEVRPPRK